MLGAIFARLAGLVGISPLVVEAIAIALVLAAGVTGTVVVYDKGYRAANAEWEAKALQSKIDAMEKDRDDARAAAADATLKLAAIQAQTDAEKEQTDAYIAELEHRPTPSCALSDDDLRGLRASTAAPRAARKGAARRSGWFDGARAHPSAKAP